MKKYLLVGMILILCLILALSGCNKPPVVANVTNGLIACYPLNGNAEDSVGTKDGIIDTDHPISYTQDHLGNSNHAALFNGETGYSITIPGITLSPSNKFSVSLWIKTGATTNQYPVYCSLFGFRQENGTNFKFSVVGQDPSLDLTGNITQDTWTHIVGTYDDSTHKGAFYINGQTADTGNKSINLGSFDLNGFCLGTLWIGAIDDLRIYNRVLTVTEIEQLYNYLNN